MTRPNLAYIKSRFETGDVPDGADYAQLIDTLAAQATDLGTIGNNEETINGIENATVVDSFSASEWRMVKYLLSIKASNANKYFATELTILIDGTDVNVSQYGMVDNDGDIGTVSVSKTSGTVNITVTPNVAVTPVTVRFARMGLKA